MAREKTYERKTVRKELATWSLYEFEGDLDQVLERLRGFKEDHPEYDSFDLEHDTEYGYYGDRSENIVFHGKRMENDQEMEKRIAKYKKNQKAQKERRVREKEGEREAELRELARLKEKYEGGENAEILQV